MVPLYPFSSVSVMPSFCVRSHRASISSWSNRPFTSTALLRRFRTPSPYTVADSEQPISQTSVDPTRQIHDQVHGSSSSPKVPPDTVHRYDLRSRGRDYGLITITSHASSAQDPPLLYYGEELHGFAVLSLDDLSDIQSMDVVVSRFHHLSDRN